jgi:zinc transporter, ZIP family
LSTALAAGFMLGASAGLLWEGGRIGIGRTAAGAAVGVAFIVGTRRLLGNRREVEFGALRGTDALGALMVVGVMTVHSFTEGVGVGVSFGGGEAFGALITTAIALHNVPEGLAISLVLVPRGVSVLRAAGWSIFTSLPQPLMVPAFLFVEWRCSRPASVSPPVRWSGWSPRSCSRMRCALLGRSASPPQPSFPPPP